MKSQVAKRLSSLTDDISSARAELEHLRERLERQAMLVEDCRLRLLIAETPLADRDFHAAEAAYRRMELEVRRTEHALITLHDDEHRLALLARGA
ncbi:MAG: hypothetical protein ACRDJP_13785 [Actinomycetota bacterium]